MSMADLYDGIASLLQQDEQLLNLLGIGDTATEEEKALRLQMRSIPRNLLPENAPLLSFHALPGVWYRDVYAAPVAFDIYTNDDVRQAQQIAKRIQDMFHGVIPLMQNVEIFEAQLQSAHEKKDVADSLYGFTVVIYFTITAEK